MRAAMKPLPTLMKPLGSVDLATGEAGDGARRALRRRRGRGARRRRRGGRRLGARRSPRTRSSAATRSATSSPRTRAYLERIAVDWHAERARPACRARRVHGRRQDDARPATSPRGSAGRSSTLDRAIEERAGKTIASSSRSAARPRSARSRSTRSRRGARGDRAGRDRARRRRGDERRRRASARATAFTVLVEVDVDTAWERVRRHEPPARAGRGGVPAALRGARSRSTARSRTRVARDADGVVLAAAGVHHERGALDRLGELVPGDGPVALVADCDRDGHLRRARAGGARRPARRRRTSCRAGEEAKQLRSSSGSGASCGSTAAARSSRSAAAARPTSPGFAAATYLRGVAVGRRADDARRPGRRGDRRQDRRSTSREGKNLVGAFHWPARVVHRRDAARDAARARAAAGDGRARQDASCSPGRTLDVRGAAAYKAALCLQRPARPRPAALAQPRPHVRARPRGGGRLRPAARRGGRARPARRAAALAAATRPRSSASSTRSRSRVDRERAWQALLRDKKRSGDDDQPRAARRRRPVRRGASGRRGAARARAADRVDSA